MRDTLLRKYLKWAQLPLDIKDTHRPKLLEARKSQHNLFSCTCLVLLWGGRTRTGKCWMWSSGNRGDKGHSNSSSYQAWIILKYEVKTQIFSFFMVLTKEKTNCVFSVVHVYICMTITLMDPRTDSLVQKRKKTPHCLLWWFPCACRSHFCILHLS